MNQETIQVITALLFWLTLFGLIVWKPWSFKKTSNLSAPQAAPLDIEPPLKRQLHIAGAERVTSGFRMLESWGLSEKYIQDVVTVKGPWTKDTLPEEVQGCLATCVSQGLIRGTEVSKVLLGAGLKEGQTLFFVLSEKVPGKPSLVALVA